MKDEINNLAKNCANNLNNQFNEQLFKNTIDASMGIAVIEHWIKEAYKQGQEEQLKKELEKQRANIIRELKKNHPKGFCYICGKGKKTTVHHLKEIYLNKKGGVKCKKTNGEIPLCRDCHDFVEDVKKYSSAYKRGEQDTLKKVEEITDFVIKRYNKLGWNAHAYNDLKKELKQKLSEITGKENMK